MTELTELQEQEMIEKAKSGDPEANYQMSLWALEQAMAEPEEERWNRLAAKCLVKAAEAGYAPAKEKMAELLGSAEAKSAETKPAEKKPAETPRSAYEETDESRPRRTVAPEKTTSSAEQLNKIAGQAGAVAAKAGKVAVKAGKVAGRAAVKAGAAIAAGTSTLAKKARTSLENSSRARAEAAEEAGGSHTTQKKSILPDFSKWDDAKWKRVQIACIAICVVLAVLIAVLIIKGGKKKEETKPEDKTLQIPAADIVEMPGAVTTTQPEGGNAEAAKPEGGNAEGTAPENGNAEGTEPEGGNAAAPTATTAPEPEDEGYPSKADKAAIAAANLDVYPDEADYVTEERSVIVNTQTSPLKLRSGPNSSYRQLGELPKGTKLPLYANKNGWALVKYNDTWGWCSYDYLRS